MLPRHVGGRIACPADHDQHLVDHIARHLVQHRANRRNFVPGRDHQRDPSSVGHALSLPQCSIARPKDSNAAAVLRLIPGMRSAMMLARRVRRPLTLFGLQVTLLAGRVTLHADFVTLG